MTRHSFTNILFALALLSFILISTRNPVPYGWYILLAFLYLVVIALGSYFIQLQFFTYSYCNGRTDKPQIAITFDDGPTGQRTSDILDILKTENVPATFFCIGRHIPGREEILRRIDKEGHTIGTHSYDHHWSFPLIGTQKIADEIMRCQKSVSEIIHKKPLLFRPPFGVTDPLIAKAIKRIGVKSIGWSLRSYDTVIASPDKLLQRLSRIKNGDIILFHDAGLQTKVVLPLFIKYVRSRGFEIVTLHQLSGITAYET